MRWVNAKAEYTISWSIRPDKKSINFGIFKHPGSGHALTPNLPSSTFELPPTPGLRPEDASQDSQSSKATSSTAVEKLKGSGYKLISWHGTCEANQVSTGTHNVPKDEGGNYALVFDNTFSKSFAKSVTFVLVTYPTDFPPQLNHHKNHAQGISPESATNLKDTLNAKKGLVKRDSSDTVHITTSTSANAGSEKSRNGKDGGTEPKAGSDFFTGVLHKRRRKKHQGWARRFFCLDYTTSTLSYYQNRHSRAVRGAVPLSLAAVSASLKTKQISIDSGAEIWHLKAFNLKDFEAWTDALELARTVRSPTTPVTAIRSEFQGSRVSTGIARPESEKDWAKLESLTTRIKDTRDNAKSLAIDTDPKYLSLDTLQPSSRADSNPISTNSSHSGSPSEQSMNGEFFNGAERKPFWKRKPTSENRSVPGMFRSVSATPSTKSLTVTAPNAVRTSSVLPETKPLQSHAEEGNVHDRCMALLRSLDSIAADMTLLIAESKQCRAPSRPLPISRHSIDTQASLDEFFDAEGMNESQILNIYHESDEEGDEAESQSLASDEDSSASETEAPSRMSEHRTDTQINTSLFPSKPKSLVPLPSDPVIRRTIVSPPAMSPPSIIGHLRKNVGKDLSSISMPVSSNEPISLLQRVSETLEYSTLLDDAAKASKSSNERLIYMSAFAISNLSSARVKERSIRKPFNPMLGETFELVREDKGFRFVAEKVSHRPVRMAFQAESEAWTLTQSPMPTQKFWGKSAELVTEGKFRVSLHSPNEHFSWTSPTSFLRNIIAGEKYVEPVGTMTVVNETTGEKATVTFKSKGMFSGRSEDVDVQTFDAYGDELPLGLTGRWTSSLAMTQNGHTKSSEPPIWTVEELVPDAAKRYGFTKFAASLNEITALERENLPPTDSRLRPDQRAAEDGDLDRAENLKLQLEEAQRTRRKVMEEEGIVWTPQWFEKVEGGDIGEEVWVARTGKDSYWERRKENKWDGIERVFDVDTTR